MASDVVKNLGVYANGTIYYPSHVNACNMVPLTNRSGDSVVTGDVVVLDGANATAFVTTTTDGDLRQAFVVPASVTGDDVSSTKTINDGELGFVYGPGSYVPAAAVDAAVSVGEYLKTSSTAKKLTGTGVMVGGTTMSPSGAVAIALQAAAAAGTIPILLIPVNASRRHLVGIASVVLTSDQTSITFSNIPGSYYALIIYASLRGTDANGNVAILVAMNGDTTDAHYASRTVTMADTYNSSAATDRRAGVIPAATAETGMFASVELQLPGYTAAHYKTITSRSDGRNSSGSRIWLAECRWANTNAVTSLSFTCASGDFASGSQMHLYGLAGT